MRFRWNIQRLWETRKEEKELAWLDKVRRLPVELPPTVEELKDRGRFHEFIFVGSLGRAKRSLSGNATDEVFMRLEH